MKLTMTRFPILVVFNLFIINLPLAANAAGGPGAKNFGAQDWLDKIHVVLSVVGIVAVTTAVLLLFFWGFYITRGYSEWSVHLNNDE